MRGANKILGVGGQLIFKPLMYHFFTTYMRGRRDVLRVGARVTNYYESLVKEKILSNKIF